MLVEIHQHESQNADIQDFTASKLNIGCSRSMKHET